MPFGSEWFVAAAEGPPAGDGAAAPTTGRRVTGGSGPSAANSVTAADWSPATLMGSFLRGSQPPSGRGDRWWWAEYHGPSVSVGAGTTHVRPASVVVELPQPRRAIAASRRGRRLRATRILAEGDDGDPWKNYQHPTIHKPNKSTKSQTTQPTGDDEGDGNDRSNVDDTPNNGTDDQYQGNTPTSLSTSSPYPNGSRHPPTAAAPSSCRGLPCRVGHTLTSPVLLALLAAVAVALYVRRRARRRRLPSQGAYRAVAAHYVSSAFDEELSPDDYLSDDEEEADGGRDYWAHGRKRTIEMGTFKDDVDLTLDELNG